VTGAVGRPEALHSQDRTILPNRLIFHREHVNYVSPQVEGHIRTPAVGKVDELHNLNTATRAGAEASDTLKYFSERIPATFIYAGISLARTGLLSGTRGGQIAGRFSLIRTGPFSRGQEWTALIAAVEDSLRLHRHRPGTLTALAGEMLASYLGRLAAANHLHLLTLLAIMPRWLTGKITSHRARLPGSELLPAATQSLHQLAALTGAPATAIARALPVSGGGPQGPARAITACGDAPPPAASPSRSRYTSPPVRWSAPGTAYGFPGPASPSSTSPPAPKSSSPSTTPAGSCVTAPPSSSYAPASRPPRSSPAHPRPPGKPTAAGSSAPDSSGPGTHA